MIRIIYKILLMGVLCFMLISCNLLVKELYLSVPPQLEAELPPPFNQLEASVSTAYPVPNPYDGTSADVTVQLIVTGPGADKLYLNPGTVVIEKGFSVGLFTVSAIYDGLSASNETVTITAKAVGYEEDSATITISFP